MTAQEKYDNLKQYLRELKNAVIAFSGGVDSAFLLKIAHDVLGDSVIAVTARSCSFPVRELNESIAFCEKEGIRQIIFDLNELEIGGFSQNPINRCYLCKKELLTKIWAIAQEQNINHVAEGSNTDDDGDYRPGRIAVKEQDVKSPLRDVGLCKQEIRELSKDMDLPTWNKPSFACLASRFPYGEKITAERLSMIDKAEQLLIDMGFSQVRVRYHQNLARIETNSIGFKLLDDDNLREKIYSEFQKIGFAYTALDLLGYRTGSMNETVM